MQRTRALILSTAVAVAAGAAAIGGVPADAAGGGGCQLAGTANFDPPGLTAAGGSFTYSFSGSLSSCNGTDAGTPATGTVSAGKVYTVTTSGTDPLTGPWSVTYALPQATGTGGCAESQTQGTAIATWGNGLTVLDYTTTGAAAAVELQATVAKSATLQEVSSTGTVPSGTPTTYTVNTTSPAYAVGDGAIGQLVFSTTSPQDCQTGLGAAGISGFVGLGSTS